MGLCLSAEDLHLVLVQAFVRAKLQLGGSIVKVHVADGVPNVATPIAGLGTLERGAPTLRKA